MSRIRLGIVGCGVIGQKHATAAKASAPRVELVAVADVREESARAVADKHGVPHVFTSAQALIDSPEVDAVVLALTANLRTPLALRAFAAGKHVLTEKPVAMNAGEVRQMIAAKGKLTGACCSCRHSLLPSAKVAAEAVAAGRLGPLRVVRARATNGAGGPPKSPPPVWRVRHDLNGGGIMSNWGCYDLDYLFTVTGWTLRPRTVLARTWPVADVYASRVAEGSNAETHVAALIVCDGGTVITLERGEFMPIACEPAWQITGERGSLRMNLLPKTGNVVILDEADPVKGVMTHTLWQGDETWDMAHFNPILDFAAAILDGRPAASSLERVLTIQQLTDAIYASSRSGAAVEVGA